MLHWPMGVNGYHHMEVQLQYHNGESYGSRYVLEYPIKTIDEQ
jgi:hypothetical protein